MSFPRVLLVEDDPDWMDIYRTNLRSDKYELVEATSVEQALAQLHERDFAVVLTDLSLPSSISDYGGFDVLSETRRINTATQVIIITAFGSRSAAIQATQQGALDYVTKPVDFRSLCTS